MTQQTINVGAALNDGTGDPARTAFTKCNDNFTELYGATAGGGTVSGPQGRLTLQTATPVMITTQSAKTTIYYTPYVGNLVPIYDGSSFTMTTCAEISVATTDTSKNPAAIGASKVNDWFIWSDSGTLQLTHGPDWTSDTVRSAGTALVMVNGILLNNAAITNGPAASRGTYVGTTRSNASSQLNWIYGAVSASGTAGVFGVWNMYNRRPVASLCGDNTDTWNYASTSVRSANGSATMRHSFVSGLAEDVFSATYSSLASAGSSTVIVGVGYDVTNAFSGRTGANFTATAVTIIGAFGTTAEGFHFMQACEACQTAASSPFYGDNGAPNFYKTGLGFEGWM